MTSFRHKNSLQWYTTQHTDVTAKQSEADFLLRDMTAVNRSFSNLEHNQKMQSDREIHKFSLHTGQDDFVSDGKAYAKCYNGSILTICMMTQFISKISFNITIKRTWY